MNLNRVTLIGRVTRDPELRAMPSGMKIVSFGLATNHKFKKEGETKEITQFHNCVSFGKAAETLALYVKKGSEIYVDGRIEYKQWENKENVKMSRTEIIVENFQFGQKPKVQGEEEIAEKEEVEEVSDINPEDIPF